MTALSARAWPLGAAWRKGVLLAFVLVVLTANVEAQNVQTTAVPPSFAIQPLYVCKMEVKDLPQFEGLPSPEMTAGNNGLWAATNGMMEQWHIKNNGDGGDTDLGIDPEGGATDGGTGGGDGSGTVQAQSNTPKRRSNAAATTAPRAAAAPPPVLNARPAVAPAPVPVPVQVPFAPAAPAAPPTAATPGNARSYIISRPATGSARTYSTGGAPSPHSAPRHTQQRTRHTLNYNVAAAAAAALDQHPWLNATAAAAAGGGSGSTHAYQAPSVATHHLDRSVYTAAAQPAEAAGMSAGGSSDGEFDFDRPPLTSPTRRLFAAGQGQGRHVCNKGTATNSTTAPFGKSSFSGKVNNVVGVTMADSGVIPADAAIAVGPNHIVHVVNSMVKILPVNSNGEFPRSLKPGQMRLVPLPDWFALVASPCDGGYITPSATYDKEVGRFLVSAICGGDTNQVLLSVSADDDAMGSWILYSFAGEATMGTRMQCINESYPITFHSQVGYNKDGVFLTFVQNCEKNQETATGALIYALPKWAVYKGATYFWSPVWTAWDVFDAVGGRNNDDYYPGAFVQMQPVIPQRAADVQADVTYFVSDNLNWVNPLRRSVLTIAALINTGSLWLYEGPNAQAPAPLLVARFTNKGMNCEVQAPDVKLIQPGSDTAAGISQCQSLDGGAMRPPGVWDGGAVLYANKIYLVHRGPDLMAPFLSQYMPTLYWGIFSPSFCVGGPCGPWFGTDWGWSDGWDWDAGTWQANSDRGRYGFKDPSYYNQVFMFPSSAPPPKQFIQGRRRLQKAYIGAGSNASSSGSSSSSYSGPIAGSGQPIRSRNQMIAAVRAAKAHHKKLARQARIAAAAEAQRAQPWMGPEVTPADASPAAVAAAAAAVAAAGVTPNVLNPAFMQAAYGFPVSNSSRIRIAALENATMAAVASNRTISAAFLGGGGWNTNNFMWQGWGQNYFYYDYYQWWREHYFLRNLYMNLRIPPKVNPCKYYKDWIIDNDITFGAINSKHGVIEFVTQGDNPVGIAAPALAVRGGSMLITYSYSGPYSIPLSNGGIRAFPGVAYSVIDVNAPSMSGGSFNLAQAGAGCVEQGGNTRWGSYSGADVHFPSYKIWTAVEYAYQAFDASLSVSNAATNIAIFT